MKRILSAVFILSTFVVFSQRDLTPGKKRGDVFGKSDYKDYRYFGLQVSAGPTYMFTRSDKNNPTYATTDAIGRPLDYTFDPAGKLGFFLEVGMAHFPKKRSKLSTKLKTVLVSYYDWGLGFKYLGGTETTTINYYNSQGDPIPLEPGKGSFYNGSIYGRFTLHKNINLSKKYFIDNGLGVNFDYRLVNGNQAYDGASLPGDQSFSKPFAAQLHYDLGFGIKMSRRSYFIPGVQMPIVGFAQWRGGCAATHWFSSNYVPALFHLKLIYLFEKKAKGCPAAKGNDDDNKRYREGQGGN
mgnify:CR=1 FL=1|jgi:hypothetical protein